MTWKSDGLSISPRSQNHAHESTNPDLLAQQRLADYSNKNPVMPEKV